MSGGPGRRWRRRILGLLLALGVGAAATGSAVATGAGRSGARAHVAAGCGDLIANAADLLCQVRAANPAGGQLAEDVKLDGQAQAHAQQMLGGDFSVGDPLARAQAAGYPAYTSSAAAELISTGSGSAGNPSSVISRWMADPAQQAILTRPGWTVAGVGAVAGQPPQYTTTQPGATYSVLFVDQRELGVEPNGDISGTAPDGQSSGTRPSLARSVLLEAVSGTVRITLPGGSTSELSATRLVPTGSEIDTTAGRVRLTAARPGGGAQRADFYGGAFRVSQNRRGLTVLTLTGSLTRCATAHSARAAGARRGAQARHLWGSGKGSFSTRGRYAAATVRGTVWLTADYCGGTLIKVNRGAVRVTGIGRRLSVLVRPRHPYFVPRKK
jgi:hypothetical protein